MESAKRGDWVEIEQILLKQGERAPQVPEDTQKVPLKLWLKGYMLSEGAVIGDEIEIETIIGRKEKGILSTINPRHFHDYGKPIKELTHIGIELRNEI